MPELPEVETIRTQLADKLIGRKIEGVEVRLPKIWEGNPKDVIGAKITDVLRRAKIVILKLDNDKNIVVHLKMTGQLVYGEESRNPGNKSVVAQTISFSQGIPFAGFSLPAKTTHVILRLDKGTLFFNDMRQFGWVRVADNKQLSTIDQQHGPDAMGLDFTPEYLAKACGNWGRPIKLLLMEQSKIAGIGNIYANEALWLAGISPMKRGREISQDKIIQLFKSIKEVLEMGLKYHGSSAGDEAYVDALGQPGEMQNHTVVYQKAGSDCPRCQHKIVRSQIGGRGTFFCPKCQK